MIKDENGADPAIASPQEARKNEADRGSAAGNDRNLPNGVGKSDAREAEAHEETRDERACLFRPIMTTNLIHFFHVSFTGRQK